MQDAKEEVRARLNIEDVIGQYVQLKRAGRNFKGLSPFSGEKTPSFVVSPDKHIWHDFSSGRGGDVFTFVMEVEGMDFRQALELLAQKAGVELAVYDNKGGQELAQKKKHLLRAHDLAAQYYQQSLIKNQHAVDYVFRERGLSKEIVQQFRIGYAPTSGDALVQFLSRKGYSMQDLSEAGLTNQYGGDMFRGRMMVPLMDSVGQVIGFTARILQDDPKAPKYLNTPQTLLYDKSRHVFGLSQAKEAIRKNDYAVIVEGNLDVISSHQVGITGVVATAGTAITEYHLRALRRLSGNVRLAFDGDKAGLAATERAIPIAQNADVELTIISLSGGAKDPDELIKQDIALWQKAIDGSESLVDWVLKQYAGREDMTTAQGKSRYTTNALRTIRLLRNSVEQEHYIKLVAQTTGGNSVNLTEKLSEEDTQESRAPALRPTVNNGPRETSYDEWSYQDNLLAVSLIDGATHDLFRGVEVETFIGDERRAVAKYLSEQGGKALKDTPPDLQKYDTYVKILLLRADARYADWNEQDRYFETARLLRQVATTHKKKQKDLLTEQLRDAETVGDDSKATEIRGLINNLIKEIQNGKR